MLAPVPELSVVPPLAPVPVDISDGEPSDPTATPGPALVVAEQTDAPPAEWMKACAAFDYAKAAELLGEQGVAQANNAEHLMCIATGHQALQHGSVAINLYQQVIQQYADSHYAFQAAHHLANIYRASGNSAEHARYAQLARELSKGALLTEPALCQKIQQEGEAQNDDKVLALSKRYSEQYPDGPCSDTVESLLAEANKRKEAVAAAAAAAAQKAEQDAQKDAQQGGAADGDDKGSGDEDTPYAEEEDKESAASDKP